MKIDFVVLIVVCVMTLLLQATGTSVAASVERHDDDDDDEIDDGHGHAQSQTTGISDSEVLQYSAALQRPPSPPRPKVVVIGCGVGGMFFLHALAMKRKKFQGEGDTERLASMPDVTVYEKASDPGGVWKPYGKTKTSNGSTNMAVGIWANAFSYELEFFDYTFEDHFGFGVPIPVYHPRSTLLDYMKERVTRVEDIFQHVQFNTEVTSVVYDKDSKKFIVTTKDATTGNEDTNEYDKCIWAGGIYNKARIPTWIDDMLKSGGYVGRVMHSTELSSDLSVANKRIVIIGDSYSAEDVALQALKMKAEYVFVTTLGGSGVASWISSWPGDRVIVMHCLPTAVISNGTGLLCSEMDENDTDSEGYSRAILEGGDSLNLQDIAAVIYCTGYSRDDSYLSEELRLMRHTAEWKAPTNWTSPFNVLTNDLGDVALSSHLSSSNYVRDGLYRHASMSNPDMMYLFSVTPSFIPETDAVAWLLASYVTGETVLPSLDEMKRRNYLDKVDELSVSYLRQDIDTNYKNALEQLISDQPNHWFRTYSLEEGYDDFFSEGMRHVVKLIARHQHEGGHGGDLGSYDKLSSRGESLLSQIVREEWTRSFAVVSEESEWRTFRDADPAPFSSIYTGAKAVPLEAHWMDLDDNGNVLTKVERASEAAATVMPSQVSE